MIPSKFCELEEFERGNILEIGKNFGRKKNCYYFLSIQKASQSMTVCRIGIAGSTMVSYTEIPNSPVT